MTYELPLNAVPDPDSKISFFIRKPFEKTETVLAPNKVDYYDPVITANPAAWITSEVYSYTVINDDAVVKSANDGYIQVISPTSAYLSSSIIRFGLADTVPTLSVKIENSTASNDGTYPIAGVLDGKLILTGTFSTETNVEFFVTDSSSQNARILLTQDLAVNIPQGSRLRASFVDIKDADFFDPNWTEAFEAAEKIEVDMVIPLPRETKSAIAQAGKAHVEAMSNIRNKKERILLTGALAGLTPSNVTGEKDAAVEDIGVIEGIQGDEVTEILEGNIEDLANYSVSDAFGDTFRVAYFYPDEITVQAGSDRVLVDGFFAAAAASGYLSSNALIAEPLTNKILTGFVVGRDKLFSPLTQEKIVANGMSLLVPVAGGGRVIWGKTTTSSLFPEEEEISIVFIRDRIAKDIRRALSPYIGRAESDTTKATLYQVADSFMKSLIQRKLVTTYDNLIVQRDSVEPRQWNISVRVQPIYPTNWIWVKASVGRID